MAPISWLTRRARSNDQSWLADGARCPAGRCARALAGATSTNPVLALLGIALVLAWKNADYVGLDRFFLPLIGTPWQRPSVTTERAQLEHQLAA